MHSKKNCDMSLSVLCWLFSWKKCSLPFPIILFWFIDDDGCRYLIFCNLDWVHGKTNLIVIMSRWDKPSHSITKKLRYYSNCKQDTQNPIRVFTWNSPDFKMISFLRLYWLYHFNFIQKFQNFTNVIRTYLKGKKEGNNEKSFNILEDEILPRNKIKRKWLQLLSNFIISWCWPKGS